MTPLKAIMVTLLFALTVIHARAQVTVTGGNILLQITSPGPVGQDVISSTSTAAGLRWKQEDVVTKVTVSTSCPGQRFTLRVLATNISAGVAAPEVTLTHGMPPVDFLRDVPPGKPNIKRCTLRYTASASFEQGNSTELGNDVHSVTYTIQAQ
jgi:hypothetical protein